MLTRRSLCSGAAAGLLGGGALIRPAEAERRLGTHAGTGHGKHQEAASPSGSPASTPVGPVDTAAKWALILDFHSRATLLDKDADVPMAPSSMTKLMTAYIVYGALKQGKLRLEDEVPVSERAWRMDGSK